MLSVFQVSKSQIKVIAAIVWLSVSIVLGLKGRELFAAADSLQPGNTWSWVAVIAAVLIGAIKAHYIFGRFCLKNLDRIAALDEARPWNAFRARFYVFLATMVLLAATLTRLALGSYPALIGLAMLDISLAVALLGSARFFWTRPQP